MHAVKCRSQGEASKAILANGRADQSFRKAIVDTLCCTGGATFQTMNVLAEDKDVVALLHIAQHCTSDDGLETRLRKLCRRDILELTGSKMRQLMQVTANAELHLRRIGPQLGSDALQLIVSVMLEEPAQRTVDQVFGARL